MSKEFVLLVVELLWISFNELTFKFNSNPGWVPSSPTCILLGLDQFS